MSDRNIPSKPKLNTDELRSLLQTFPQWDSAYAGTVLDFLHYVDATVPPDETKARRPEPDDDPASMAGGWRYENAGNPTDGQLMDQLETAFEKMNDGYVCMDMALRKRLAITLNEFMRPAEKSNGDQS